MKNISILIILVFLFISCDNNEDKKTTLNQYLEKYHAEKTVAYSSNSLEEVFINFKTCDFSKISYDPSKKETTHSYFKLAKLEPYKVEQSLAFYSVSDSLFGIPVSKIILPVTWAFVSVTFDLPVNDVRTKLSTVFGKGFEAADESEIGYKPILISSKDDPTKTVLYCDEPKYE